MCLCSVLFPHIRSRPNFGTNSGDDAQSVLLQDAKKKRSLAQRTQLRGDSHTRVGKKTKNKKNYPVEQIKAKKQTKKKTSLQLRSSLFPLCLSFCFKTCVKSAARKRAASRFPSQDSTRALLWSCIFLHWFQYRSGWTSLCHATSADNKRERGTEGEGGGEIGGCLGNRSPFCNCALLISWKCSGVHGCAL